MSIPHRREAPGRDDRRWVAAKFEHDAPRPSRYYAPPQYPARWSFHLKQKDRLTSVTHTPTATRTLQTQSIRRSSRSELAPRFERTGYEIERGESSQPEIKGYSQEYLEAVESAPPADRKHLAKGKSARRGSRTNRRTPTREVNWNYHTKDMQTGTMQWRRSTAISRSAVVRSAQERSRAAKG